MWQLCKAKFSSIVPLLLIVESCGFPAAEFPKENLFVCLFCCCFGFFSLVFVSTAFSYLACELGLVSLPGL